MFFWPLNDCYAQWVLDYNLLKLGIGYSSNLVL